MPRRLGTLGLAAADLERHIAWDIGAAAVSSRLATMLDAVLIRQTYSRLVIDCNRAPDAPSSIVEISEATPIPGNAGLSAEAREARRREVFEPSHPRTLRTSGPTFWRSSGRRFGGNLPRQAERADGAARTRRAMPRPGWRGNCTSPRASASVCAVLGRRRAPSSRGRNPHPTTQARGPASTKYRGCRVKYSSIVRTAAERVWRGKHPQQPHLAPLPAGAVQCRRHPAQA